jgi:hypothetical protein
MSLVISRRGFGQVDPDEGVDPADVELNPAKALISKESAYVAIPRGELVAFARQQAFTFIAGFTVGMTFGALFRTKR